jgi:hypothetical protein
MYSPNFIMNLHICYCFSHIEGIMPEGRINKITDLQETKFLRLSCLTNVHY